MIIILSYNQINCKLSNDIGDLPAMLLPVGNKKLLEHQVNKFRDVFACESIMVVLPTGYQPSFSEQVTLNQLSVTLEFADTDADVHNILMQIVSALPPEFDEPIRIQLGSTWLNHIPTQDDCMAIAASADVAAHGVDSFDQTWIGYVSFASASQLVNALADMTPNAASSVRAAASVSSPTCPISAQASQQASQQTRQEDSYQFFAQLIDRYQQKVTNLDKVPVADWYDCDCDDGYFIARASLTTERSFNTLCIRNGMVTKSSHDDKKIKAEAHWYTHVPTELNRFLPKFLDQGSIDQGIKQSRYYYRLEYLPLFPLNELYVHGQSAAQLWQHVFAGIQDFFALSADKKHLQGVCIEELQQDCDYLYQQKTLSRLNKYASASAVDLQQPVYYDGCELGSISDITQHCMTLAAELPFVPAIMHGDLCFSNLLFDSKVNSIKMIDPRGIDADGNMSIYGNQTYDLAKVAHSVIGMYDHIIAGQYRLVDSETPHGIEQTLHFYADNRCQLIQEAFLRTEFIAGLSSENIMPAVVLLFLSMLPLHADRPDRQHAMLLNAYRLYQAFVLTKPHTMLSPQPSTLQRNLQAYNMSQALAS